MNVDVLSGQKAAAAAEAADPRRFWQPPFRPVSGRGADPEGNGAARAARGQQGVEASPRPRRMWNMPQPHPPLPLHDRPVNGGGQGQGCTCRGIRAARQPARGRRQPRSGPAAAAAGAQLSPASGLRLLRVPLLRLAGFQLAGARLVLGYLLDLPPAQPLPKVGLRLILLAPARHGEHGAEVGPAGQPRGKPGQGQGSGRAAAAQSGRCAQLRAAAPARAAAAPTAAARCAVPAAAGPWPPPRPPAASHSPNPRPLTSSPPPPESR